MPAAVGRPFDRLTFFLDCLEMPVRISLVKGAEEKYDIEKRGVHPFVSFNARDFLDVPSARVYREMARLLKKYVPDAAIDEGSIKIRLWRFWKAGIMDKITRARYAAAPDAKKKHDKAWAALRRKKIGRVTLTKTQAKQYEDFANRMIARSIFEWQPARVREKFYLIVPSASRKGKKRSVKNPVMLNAKPGLKGLTRA